MVWKPGQSGNPSGKRKPKPAKRADDYVNVLTGAGVMGRDKRLGGTWAPNTTTVEEAELIWRSQDLAARLIECYPNELLRNGFEFRVADTYGESAKEVCTQVHSRWEELDIVGNLWTGAAYERAYGGGALFLGVNDLQAPSAPLNVDRVASFDFLTALQPDELQPEAYYEDPLAPKYGEVKLWNLRPHAVGKGGFASSGVIVHESRLIIFPGIRVSRSRRGQVLEGWGDSILTRLKGVLRDFDTTWTAAGILMTDFAQAVYKMKDFDLMAAENNVTAIRTRMQALELGRSTNGAVVIDMEDDFLRLQTPITGMPEMLDRFATRVAAAGDIPVTLLMGQSPAGLNATGASDIRFFYDRVRAMQDRKLRPALERLARITLAALDLEEPEHWSIYFNPLWQPTEQEQAQARFTQAQTDVQYIQNAVLSPEEVALSRFGGEDYSFVTQVDFEARKRSEPAADPPAKTEQQLEEEERPQELQAASQPPAAAEEDSPREDEVRLDFVEKRGSKWVVVSHEGEVLGTFKTKAEAMKRLGEIEYWKSAGAR